MILSMTGYGRGSTTFAGKRITLEVKALNSKQLDLIIKLPNRFRCMEGTLRHNVAVGARRGKVEVTAAVESLEHHGAAQLNLDVIRSYKEEIEKMDALLGLEPPKDWHSVLLRLPDVLRGEDSEISPEEEKAFEEAAAEALDNMTRFRRDEGEKLQSFFRTKLANIEKLLAEVVPFEESRVAKIKNRLKEQLEKIQGVDYDHGRLEQELIYYIEKLDISEEKQRLKTHIDYFRVTMDDATEDSKGKKLGFIAQEMGREINTLGSKSNNAEMQIIVVKMKDELEQIKEQVLNVL